MIYSRLLGAGILLASTAMSSLAFAGDTWTGGYIGAVGGFSSLDADTVSFGNKFNDGSPVEGGFFGGDLGFNEQINNLVLGVEGDYAFSNASGDSFIFTLPAFPLDMHSLGTIRARAGMAFGENENTLLFATAGLAVGEFERTDGGIHEKATHTGLVVGLGLEHMITDSVSIKAEYEFVKFGKKTYDRGETVKYDGHVVKLGVNFHF